MYQSLSHIANKASVNLLQKCMRKGVAYHHAGLDTPDRTLVGAFFCFDEFYFQQRLVFS